LIYSKLSVAYNEQLFSHLLKQALGLPQRSNLNPYTSNFLHKSPNIGR